MWKLSLPWWEFIARAFVVYIFLLIILRVTGKRQVGQLAPFDLVLLLVLSNALQNAMNGGGQYGDRRRHLRRHAGGIELGAGLRHLSQQENRSFRRGPAAGDRA